MLGGPGSTAAADLGIRAAKGPIAFPHLPAASNLPETTGGPQFSCIALCTGACRRGHHGPKPTNLPNMIPGFSLHNGATKCWWLFIWGGMWHVSPAGPFHNCNHENLESLMSRHMVRTVRGTSTIELGWLSCLEGGCVCIDIEEIPQQNALTPKGFGPVNLEP